MSGCDLIDKDIPRGMGDNVFKRTLRGLSLLLNRFNENLPGASHANIHALLDYPAVQT